MAGAICYGTTCGLLFLQDFRASFAQALHSLNMVRPGCRMAYGKTLTHLEQPANSADGPQLVTDASIAIRMASEVWFAPILVSILAR